MVYTISEAVTVRIMKVVEQKVRLNPEVKFWMKARIREIIEQDLDERAIAKKISKMIAEDIRTLSNVS